MTERDSKRVAFDVGRRIAELRAERELTQEALADRLGMAPKYFQRIERGVQNLTLRTLARLGEALSVPIGAFFDPPVERRIRKGRPRKATATASPSVRPKSAVPLFTLEAAAGVFGEAREVGRRGSVLVDRRDVSGMFAARVVGASMEPRIPSQSIALFREPVRGDVDGKVILVQHRDIEDPETGASYTVKRVRERRNRAGHLCAIDLISFAPAFPPLSIGPESATAIRFVAEFVEIVDTSDVIPGG